MNKMLWIEQLKKIAEANYDLGYGWQVFVECFGDKDWARMLSTVESFEEAKTLMANIASHHQENHDSAVNEIF